MLYTVVDTDYVLFGVGEKADSIQRSTNPFDYIRGGWFLDNSVMYRGVNKVNIKFNYPINFTSNIRDSAD